MKPVTRIMRPCTVDGCDRPEKCKGLCEAHYRRKRLTGDVCAQKPLAEKWTSDQLATLRSAYEAAGGHFVNIRDLGERLGKTEDAIYIKAGRLGLTNRKRGLPADMRKNRPMFDNDAERRQYQSQQRKEWLAANGHPKGMAGKSHSEKTKACLAIQTRDRWLFMPESKRSDMILKGLKTKRANGTPIAQQGARGTWKVGWREFGGVRKYYRSRWEANYGRYLEWLRTQGQIASWEHEPDTFWFENIKRGVRSYLPDFKVTEIGGSHAYHEVKGWMDSRSKTTIKRFRKYYPNETLIVVDKTTYAAIERNMSRMIGGWE